MTNSDPSQKRTDPLIPNFRQVVRAHSYSKETRLQTAHARNIDLNDFTEFKSKISPSVEKNVFWVGVF